MFTVPTNVMVPCTSCPGVGEVSMIWLGVQPVKLTDAGWGGRFANWVMASAERVPVGVEIRSRVEVGINAVEGSPGMIKVATKNSAQNKTAMIVEMAAACPSLREENSRSIVNTAVCDSRHERHNQRKENKPPIAKTI